MAQYYRVCEVPADYRAIAEEALADARRDLGLDDPIELVFFGAELDPVQGILDNCEAYQRGIDHRHWPMFCHEPKHDQGTRLRGLALKWSGGPYQIRVYAHSTKRELIGTVSHEVRHIDQMRNGEDVGKDYTGTYEDWLEIEENANRYQGTKLREYEREHPPVVIKPPPTLPPELRRLAGGGANQPTGGNAR